MFERVAFRRDHLSEMLKQEINHYARDFFTNVNFDKLETLDSFTGLLNGKPVVCGGVVPLWKDRGSIWTVFDESSKECFLPVYRGMKSFIKDAQVFYRRLELSVPCEIEIAVRRAKLLGFTVECERAPMFMPDGRDCTLMRLLREA